MLLICTESEVQRFAQRITVIERSEIGPRRHSNRCPLKTSRSHSATRQNFIRRWACQVRVLDVFRPANIQQRQVDTLNAQYWDDIAVRSTARDQQRAPGRQTILNSWHGGSDPRAHGPKAQRPESWINASRRLASAVKRRLSSTSPRFVRSFSSSIRSNAVRHWSPIVSSMFLR